MMPGDIVRISLSDGRFGFGWVIRNPLIAFFDLCLREPSPSVKRVVESPVAFKVWVMNYAVTKKFWPVIGHEELPVEQLVEPRFFKIDPIGGQLYITSGGGKEIPATRAECEKLENAAVWDPEYVVSRLEDHFAGRPNKWVELLRLK